jgi:hypothetical protein
VKSLAPDGTQCNPTTPGLLHRARIKAGRLVPVGKETDRRWEQGEDPNMIDSDIHAYEKWTKLVIADSSERKKSSADSFDHSTNGGQDIGRVMEVKTDQAQGWRVAASNIRRQT